MTAPSAAVAMVSGGQLYVFLPESETLLYSQLPSGFTTEDVRREIETFVPRSTQRLVWMAHDRETVAWLPSTGQRQGIVNTKNLADALPMTVSRCTVFDAVNTYLGREKSWPTTNTAVVMVENYPDGNGGHLAYYIDRRAHVAAGIGPVLQEQWLTTSQAVVGDQVGKIIAGHTSLTHLTVVSVVGLTAIRYGTDSAF